MKKTICYLSCIFLVSCSGGPDAPDIDSEYPNVNFDAFEVAWDKEKEGDLYTKLTYSALEKYGNVLLTQKLEHDGFKRYCERYNELGVQERRAFWIRFISGLTYFESGFDSSTAYKESFTYKGKPVVSRGLMQMSIGSVNNKFYDCQVEKESDLHDPRVNINCAVKIMNYWVKKDSRLYGRTFYKEDGKQKTRWLGLARYWSPVRYEAKEGSSKKKYTKFHAELNALDVCR